MENIASAEHTAGWATSSSKESDVANSKEFERIYIHFFLVEAAPKSLLAVRRGRRDSCVSVEQLYEKWTSRREDYYLVTEGHTLLIDHHERRKCSTFSS